MASFLRDSFTKTSQLTLTNALQAAISRCNKPGNKTTQSNSPLVNVARHYIWRVLPFTYTDSWQMSHSKTCWMRLSNIEYSHIHFYDQPISYADAAKIFCRRFIATQVPPTYQAPTNISGSPHTMEHLFS